MYSKYKNLLAALIESEKDWVTAGNLSAYLNISVRSVKNYINEINSIHKNLIQSSNHGFHIDKTRTRQLLSSVETQPPSTPKERTRFIIKKLLADTQKHLDLYQLCEDEMFVSLETVKKDLSAVRRRFREFDLHVTSRGFTVSLEGSELDKRKMLSNILYEEFSENIFSLEAIEKVFPRYDIKYAYHVIVDTCKEHHFFVNEYSLLTLLLDIVISIDRIKNDFSLPEKTAEAEQEQVFDNPEELLVKDIIRRMEAHFCITYNELELAEITVIIVSSLVKTDFDAITMKNIEQFISADCAALIQPLRAHLASYDFIDTENDKFMSRLILHINNLLLRLKKQYIRKNPLTEHVKTSCPMIFECAVALSWVITQQTGYRLSEHETAYIALHIGSLLSTHLSVRNKILCVLLFPGYYDYGEKLTARLAEAFGASLVIRHVITRVEELQKITSPVDLIISAVKIPVSFKIPCVYINPFMTERDFDGLRVQIETIHFRKKKERLFEQLQQISGPEIFCKDKTFENEDAAIRYMSDMMIKWGYADKSFGDEVLAREHSYSTAYGNLAVPHSMQMNAKKTGMFVLISDKPIPWGANSVNIVLLFSVKKETRSLFYDIFDNLVVLLLENPNKTKIMACDTHEAFIRTIIECL
jgi:lichenan operon transcriptional antiterminator